jgi:hypothetical protein
MHLFKKLYLSLPSHIKTSISDFRFYLKSQKLYNARLQYRYIDEDLKYIHLMEAINYVRVAGVEGKVLPQTFFEFGCHSGRTFSAAVNACKYLKMDNAEFFAFDSFKGLPETTDLEDGYFQAGTFNTSRDDFLAIIKKNTGLELPLSNIFEGYFSSSLTKKLQGILPTIGVVHIDVDLYSSTVEVFKFIKPLLIEGSVLLFDDWYCFPCGKLQGESKAFSEFLSENPEFSAERWKSYSTFGQSFFLTNN